MTDAPARPRYDHFFRNALIVDGTGSAVGQCEVNKGHGYAPRYR